MAADVIASWPRRSRRASANKSSAKENYQGLYARRRSRAAIYEANALRIESYELREAMTDAVARH